MPVVDITKNADGRTLVVTSHFPAPLERIWRFWSEAEQLEQWWGPPGYPATFTDADFRAGGRVNYYMTGPEGEKFGGYWDVESVNAPSELIFTDGFADAEGNPQEAMPVGRNVVQLREVSDGTEVVTTTTYASAEDLQKVLSMGMEEGLTQAVSQIDAILAA